MNSLSSLSLHIAYYELIITVNENKRPAPLGYPPSLASLMAMLCYWRAGNSKPCCFRGLSLIPKFPILDPTATKEHAVMSKSRSVSD
jgi:hypothetical protein